MSTLPLTYPDLICDLDLDPFASETTSDFQNLIQDVSHVLQELPGTNPDDPLRGVGVQTYLSGTVDNLRNLPAVIEAQLETDERINDCQCTLFPQEDGSYLIQVAIAVSAKVLTLEFTWSNSAGLVLSGGNF